jgi:alpha-beta hydrolase superfamily lysophospholipase
VGNGTSALGGKILTDRAAVLLIQIVLAAIGLYVALAAVVALVQTSLLFPTGLVARTDVYLPPSARRVSVKAADGTELQGVHIPASTSPEGRLLLGFGGNAWNAATLARLLNELVPGHEVVVFHYRGYPPSGGKPSAASLLQDALVVHDSLTGFASPRPVIAIGLSIGAGPAMHLARHRKLSGAILVTPFDSLAELARYHYWWAPVRLLLYHKMEIATDAAGVDEPVAIITAERDSIVPAERTEGLRSKIRRLVMHRIIADADHNSLYDHPGFAVALREAVALIQSSGRGSK